MLVYTNWRVGGITYSRKPGQGRSCSMGRNPGLLLSRIGGSCKVASKSCNTLHKHPFPVHSRAKALQQPAYHPMPPPSRVIHGIGIHSAWLWRAYAFWQYGPMPAMNLIHRATSCRIRRAALGNTASPCTPALHRAALCFTSCTTVIHRDALCFMHSCRIRCFTSCSAVHHGAALRFTMCPSLCRHPSHTCTVLSPYVADYLI
ncbi:hypothetical protein OH77DRAFT_320374 [Trametes cingulata]|nr:hypothetical protein OH77DRAFT_320374 [Trametes cingulata]